MHDVTAFPDVLPSGIHTVIGSRTDLKARYVWLNDAGNTARKQWLTLVFEAFAEYEYHLSDTHFCSLAFSDYDVMTFGGKDAGRLRLILRQNELILRHKVKLCLLSDGTPQDRAALLMAGFDDVIDTARTSPAEAIARISSIWRRYGLAEQRNHAALSEKSQLAQISTSDRLNNRQKTALLMLVASGNNPVSYAKMCNSLSRDYESMSIDCLKVFICSLRKWLRPGMQIRAVSGVGYVQCRNGPTSGPAGVRRKPQRPHTAKPGVISPEIR